MSGNRWIRKEASSAKNDAEVTEICRVDKFLLDHLEKSAQDRLQSVCQESTWMWSKTVNVIRNMGSMRFQISEISRKMTEFQKKNIFRRKQDFQREP